MNKSRTSLPGIHFEGDITINGKMFDIHDNNHVHVYVNKEPRQLDEEAEYVDFVFFTDGRLSTMEGQQVLRSVLRKVLPRMDADSGRDWVAPYIAYHFFTRRELMMKGHSDFFGDIDALMPGLLTKVKADETGDKRYKAYSDLLRLECQRWFVLSDCLPPMAEWTSRRFSYQVDDTRRKRIQQLVKEIYQGLLSELR